MADRGEPLTHIQLWAIWLLAFAMSFAALEAWAIADKQPDSPTLSESWWRLVGLKGEPRIYNRRVRVGLRIALGVAQLWLFFHLEFRWPR